MEKLTPQEKAWIGQLESKTPAIILTAIREIRYHGNLRMLPYLFKLMQPSTHEIVRKSIIMLIGEIKVKEAASAIVTALENIDMGEDFTPMVAACWQSGLDFSMYLPAFIKIFVNGDYQAAIEAFSVIEESMENASDDMQKKCIKMLDDAADKVSQEKYLLFRELVKVVSAQLS
jgi:hypothetical protein